MKYSLVRTDEGLEIIEPQTRLHIATFYWRPQYCELTYKRDGTPKRDKMVRSETWDGMTPAAWYATEFVAMLNEELELEELWPPT